MKHTDEQMAVIGKIIKHHGVYGGLKVFPYSDYPERVKELKRVYLEQGSDVTEAVVSEAFVHGRFWVIHFTGVETIEKASKLIGSLIKIPLSERLELPQDSYYLDEIIGLEVYTVEGLYLGSIVDVLLTAGNDVYVVHKPVADSKPEEVLIPALKSVVLNIDAVKKRVDVLLPEGLL